MEEEEELYSYLFTLKLYLREYSKRKMKGKMSKDKKVRRVFEYENCTWHSDLPSDTRILVDIPNYKCFMLF